MKITTRAPHLRILAGVRDELRERREARDAYRALERDLAGYNTPAEVDDLLAALRWQDDPESQVIRDILLGNLNRRSSRLAS
jgi:hypothetical protein